MTLTPVCRLINIQIPSFFIFLMGLLMWLNFSWINSMYIYWPVVLIGLTAILIFLPARVLYHRSRKWFAFSNVSDNIGPIVTCTD